jgi:1-aminocyclopropane-1-carboxylate deaminase
MKELGLTNLVTFGGAHSNHIAATAAAGKIFNVNTVGIIRGSDNNLKTPTLQFAAANGMILRFLSREDYLGAGGEQFHRDLEKEIGPFFLVPEGGSNELGLAGCGEILQQGWNYDYIICPCGTGTTFAGLVRSSSGSIMVGINVLKGENETVERVRALLKDEESHYVIKGNEGLDGEVISNHLITDRYCFKGYARYDQDLISFKKQFEEETGILIDHIYTVKLFFGIIDLKRSGKFGDGKILAIHTGGLQGNEAFESRYLGKEPG